MFDKDGLDSRGSARVRTKAKHMPDRRWQAQTLRRNAGNAKHSRPLGDDGMHRLPDLQCQKL